MRFRLMLVLLALLFVAACQGPPPTVIYIVLSPTPDATQMEATAVAAAALTAAVTDEPTVSESLTPTSTPTLTLTPPVLAATEPPTATPSPAEVIAEPQAPDATPASPTAVLPSPTPTITPLPANFPTPVFAQIQVAEQLFEGGRMFWLQPTSEIWALIVTAEGRGEWLIFQDTFVEGEPERDETLVVPAGFLQPERGFGKLWRENDELRGRLGWAVTPEFGYVSRYEYHAGGQVDAQGVYQPGPGHHVLFSLYEERFRFNEIDGTWQLGGT
ncbi:MAG: hypothetical protein SNJ59_06145 [Aggregatilineales bacterium]